MTATSLHPARRWLLRGLLIACALLWAGCGGSKTASQEPWLTTPELAVGSLQAKTLFYNGAARVWLLQKRPELLAPDDRQPTPGIGKSFAQATQDPKLFRQLDRQQRFDALLLVGDPSQSRPLLEHLRETQDWKLTYLDHTSLIFRRDAAERWQPSQLEALRTRLATASARDRSRAWAQVAVKLVAVHELSAAKPILEEAQRADAQTAEVWSAQGSYQMALGDFKAATESARRALKVDGESLPALACLAQSLYATKRFSEAYAVSSKLLAKLPEDPGILFYHSKIAHESRNFEDEVRALRKLIDLARQNGRPISGYRVYLGQALAHDGDREASVAEFRQALADPDLPGEQRKYAEECLARLAEKAR